MPGRPVEDRPGAFAAGDEPRGVAGAPRGFFNRDRAPADALDGLNDLAHGVSRAGLSRDGVSACALCLGHGK